MSPTRTVVGLTVCAIALTALAAASIAAPASPATLEVSFPGRPDAALLDLFAPRGPVRASFDIRVTPLPIAATERQFAALAEGQVLRPWSSEKLGVLDAFGYMGTYNLWHLAELFGSRPVLVARAPFGRNGRVTHGITLLSPHPDATLSRIQTGTLIIVVRVEEGPAR